MDHRLAVPHSDRYCVGRRALWPPPPRRLGTSPAQSRGRKASLLLPRTQSGGDIEERDRGGNRTRTRDRCHLSAGPLSGSLSRPTLPEESDSQDVTELRHSFIAAAVDAEVALCDVQEAASNADPTTTMRYGRATRSLDRRATTSCPHSWQARHDGSRGETLLHGRVGRWGCHFSASQRSSVSGLHPPRQLFGSIVP
jgi:hypothetical protein